MSDPRRPLPGLFLLFALGLFLIWLTVSFFLLLASLPTSPVPPALLGLLVVLAVGLTLLDVAAIVRVARRADMASA